jgi:hypothetical protein
MLYASTLERVVGLFGLCCGPCGFWVLVGCRYAHVVDLRPTRTEFVGRGIRGTKIIKVPEQRGNKLERNLSIASC